MTYEPNVNDTGPEDKSVFEIACAYLSAGLSLIPIKPDGSKRPFGTLLPWDDLLEKHVWKPYQAQLPSHDELINWFVVSPGAGIGIVGGRISGNLEILDFDHFDLYDVWCALVQDVAPGLLGKLTLLIGTPRPGRHVPYRCERIEGNQKLACEDDEVTLIETRGDGGYIVAAGSPLACHPSGRPYEVLKGSWEYVPTITIEERDILLGLARSFNRHQQNSDDDPPSYRSNGIPRGDRPGDDYNARATWEQVIEPSGWTKAGTCGPATLWKRPGKTEPGHSAITGNGDDRLCVFSSNAAPLEPYGDRKKTYSKFQAYTALSHHGDFSAAAKTLVEMGYGSRNGQPHVSDEEEPEYHTNSVQMDSTITNQQETPIHLTDRGNALRLVKAHGKDLRYIYRWKKWLVWDGTRWVVDEGNLVERLAKQVITDLYLFAQYVSGKLAQQHADEQEVSEDMRKLRDQRVKDVTSILRWAIRSESAERLSGMLKHARSEYGIAIIPEQLDANPWILNCVNGTIDLKTGTLYPHRREDLCTKRLDTPFDPQALCPHWDQFLWRIMGGPKADAEGHEGTLTEQAERAERLIGYLQRSVGYSLTGVIREQVLQFMYGTGDNGKTTFSEVLAAMLGEYYQKAPQELLMRKARQQTGGPSPELARLCGVRLVIAQEVDEKHRLNEAQVKDLTGNDRLTARGLYEDYFEFNPTHKIWMYGNHKPVIIGTDDAIWKRPKLIPFTEKIPKAEQVTDLRETYLIPELPGILAWAVRGCLEWQEKGLQVPAEVEIETTRYRNEMDLVNGFISDRCETGTLCEIRGTDLHGAYLQYIEGDKDALLSARKFYGRLYDRGFDSRVGTGNKTILIGLKLKPTPKPDDDCEPES